ncbi:MAG TPA: hypothetical protein VGR62_02565 [Candidatus Binatia bacterium]|nr:hypothetical protein [Candidatus Binatia bacterium]
MKRRRRSWLLLVLGLATMGLALWTFVTPSRPPVPRLTFTGGPLVTTRALVARMIAAAVASRGEQATVVETTTTEDALAKVDNGQIDFALVSEAYRVVGHPHLREVTPLYVEALHLLVRGDLVHQVDESLAALRGRSVDLGPQGSTSEGLSTAVLAFAGVIPKDGAPKTRGYVVDDLQVDALETLIKGKDPAAFPDAILHLGTVPSKIALQLIRGFGYQLVPLPFADAFRLNALISGDLPETDHASIERQHIIDTVIPAFTYQTEPAIPAEPLHTIGARLTLIANDRVSPEAVELVLDTVFSTQVARVAHPPLDRSLLAMPGHLKRHDGTLEFQRRDQPYITQDTVDALSNSFSVIGAIAGGLLFLWQWWRQRRQAERDDRFGGYLVRLAEIERRMTGLELAATLELEPLVDLQREVLTLKGDALDGFASGELGNQAALSSLLMPLNATRDHIGDLILHVRDTIEEQAQAEGVSATELWTDAIDQPEKPESDE